jgi:hypothetical protein
LDVLLGVVGVIVWIVVQLATRAAKRKRAAAPSPGRPPRTSESVSPEDELREFLERVGREVSSTPVAELPAAPPAPRVARPRPPAPRPAAERFPPVVAARAAVVPERGPAAPGGAGATAPPPARRQRAAVSAVSVAPERRLRARFAGRLRSPASAREAMVLAELVSAPLSLRRRPGSVVTVVAAALVLTLGSADAAAAADDLAGLRGIYDNALLTLETNCEQQVKSWPASYVEALRGLQPALQKSGDLEGWVAVNKELERFARDGNIPDETVVETPAALRAVQVDYKARPDRYLLDKAQRIRSLADMYLKRLEATKKHLTVAGKMDEAMAWNDEIKRVESSVAVRSASFVIAEHEATQEPSPPAPAKRPAPAAPAPQPPPAPTVQPPPQPEREMWGRTRDPARTYAGQPPALTGVSFGPLRLTPTGNARLARPVAVEGQYGTALDTQTSRDRGGMYSRGEVKVTRTRHVVRLAVRIPTASDTMDNATAVVQLFCRNVAKQSGKVIPLAILTQHIKLERLTPKAVYLDCPPIYTFKGEDTYHSPYYSSSTRFGREFYGAIVSVYDAEGSLVYQGASTGSLAKLATTAMPEPYDSMDDLNPWEDRSRSRGGKQVGVSVRLKENDCPA